MRLGPLIIDVQGFALTSREREMLSHPWVGGVIYFTRNFESKTQIRELSREIHSIRREVGRAPLLICIDHEGGRVQRFRDGFTEIPAMSTLGQLWDSHQPDAQAKAIDRAKELGATLARELLQVGIDFSFTPVLDLNWGRSDIIGERAFHSDPEVVAHLARALMQGLASSGMKSCGKHFPGHGWPAADSHLALPVDDRPLDEILSIDAKPYARLADLDQDGLPLLSSVMPAHIHYSQIDAMPAGFSRTWITHILRARIGYRGLVISDDLSMAGAAVLAQVEDRAQAAFEAGCDATLICNSPDLAARALEYLPARMPNFLNDPNRLGLERLRPSHAVQ